MSFLIEEVLSTKDRKKLKDSTFGLPEERKFPLNDAKHVKSALAYFRFCSPDKKKQLASRILAAAKKFGVNISKDSEVYKLIHEAIEPEEYDIKNNDRVILEADDDDDEEDYTDDLDNDTDEPEDYTQMLDDEPTNDIEPTDDTGAGDEPAPDPEDYTQDLDDTGTTDDEPTDYTNMMDDETEPVDDTGEEDNPTDYTDDLDDNDNPNEPTDDTNDEPADYTQDLDDSNPDNINNNVNQDNPDNMPEGNAGGNDAEGGDEPEDYTQDLDDGGDASSDDGENPEGEDPTNADMGAGGADTGVSSDIQDLQNTTFSNLTPQQLQLRIANVKQSFIDLHNEIVDTIERLSVVNKSSDTIESINFVNNTLSDLKRMLLDSIGESFSTRSLVENQIMLQRFIATYGMCVKILDKVTKKNELRQNEK